MVLRDHLRARAIDALLLARLEALCVEVVDRIENGEPCDDLLSEIERASGLRYEAEYFFELHGWQSPRDFAARAALGEAPHVPDITREELIELVNLVRIGDPPAADYYLDLFRKNVTHPDPAALIGGSKKYWPDGHSPSAEEVVEVAVAECNIIRS